jgi:hypothetical protein
VIITARRIPARMMMTQEIDIYADGVADPEPISDLIDASIGEGSQFHRTFSYYGDGVSPGTAIMPDDWRSRAIEYLTPDRLVTAICPSANDIAIAKLCAWREKDRDWLRVAVDAGVISTDRIEKLLRTPLPRSAPDLAERLRRLDILRLPANS